MKLLFDENVSYKLVAILAVEFPGSSHVRDTGLRGEADERVWSYARSHGFVIATKDTDFRERSYVEGFPPKVIWLDVGTADTLTIADLIRRERQRIDHFAQDDEASVLILSISK